MNNLNSVLIEGNLVRDPIFRSTSKGTPICTFSVANNRYYKQESGLEKEVSYFEVETWAKLAESCYNLGHKGRGARVVGRLKQDRWTGQDGKTKTKVTIVAEHVEFRPEPKKEEAPAKPGAQAEENFDSLAEAAFEEGEEITEEELAEVTF